MIVFQISEKVKPHPLVVTLLTQVEEIIPKWKIVPTKDVIDSAFKDPIKREKVQTFEQFTNLYCQNARFRPNHAARSCVF